MSVYLKEEICIRRVGYQRGNNDLNWLISMPSCSEAPSVSSLAKIMPKNRTLEVIKSLASFA